MSLLRQVVLRARTKVGRGGEVDQGIPTSVLAGELASRAAALARGAARMRKPCFIGRSVRIRARRRVSLGRYVAIGDHSVLDGCSQNGITIGDHSRIGRYCTILGTSHLSRLGSGLTLGRNSGLGDFAHVGCAGQVTIGDDVIVGPFVSFHAQEHIFDNLVVPIRAQGTRARGISVGSNVWIGAKVTLLDGAVVGSNSIVAAGSLVKGQFPDGVILGGVPARVLRELWSDEEVRIIELERSGTE